MASSVNAAGRWSLLLAGVFAVACVSSPATIAAQPNPQRVEVSADASDVELRGAAASLATDVATSAFELVDAHHPVENGAPLAKELLVHLRLARAFDSKAGATAWLQSTNGSWHVIQTIHSFDGVQMDSELSFAEAEHIVEVVRRSSLLEVNDHGDARHLRLVWLGTKDSKSPHGGRSECPPAAKYFVEMESIDDASTHPTALTICASYCLSDDRVERGGWDYATE